MVDMIVRNPAETGSDIIGWMPPGSFDEYTILKGDSIDMREDDAVAIKATYPWLEVLTKSEARRKDIEANSNGKKKEEKPKTGKKTSDKTEKTENTNTVPANDEDKKAAASIADVDDGEDEGTSTEAELTA